MKRLLYIILIVTAASCKREPLITYDTSDNLYFNLNYGFRSYRDSMDFSFANKDVNVNDAFLLVPVATTGVPSQKDRQFKLIVDPASTAIAGTHYELPLPIIHAGKVADTLRIRFKRTPDLASGMKKLILRLEPNEFFTTDLRYKIITNPALDTVDVLKFSIGVSDILEAGPYWTSSYAAYFGTFSVKKVKLINSLYGMPLDFWTVSMTNAIRSSATYYASSTSRYLQDQALQGNIIYDENGQPMKMGPAFQ